MQAKHSVINQPCMHSFYHVTCFVAYHAYILQ